jgi:hypothetical protein
VAFLFLLNTGTAVTEKENDTGKQCGDCKCLQNSVLFPGKLEKSTKRNRVAQSTGLRD